MNRPTGHFARGEQMIAALLWYGTWIATGVVEAGTILGVLHSSGHSFARDLGRDLVEAGVALFILLPIARVVLMLIIFLHERDYTYVMIAALVLAIIAAGIVMGL